MAGHLPFPATYEPVEELNQTPSRPLNWSQNCGKFEEQELETDFESLSSVSSRRDRSLNLTSTRFDLQDVPEIDRDLRELINAKLADLDSSNASSLHLNLANTSFTPGPTKFTKKLLEIG